jgi:hypothetical protein
MRCTSLSRQFRREHPQNMNALNESELCDIRGGFAPLNSPRTDYRPAVPSAPIPDLDGGDGTPRHVDN